MKKIMMFCTYVILDEQSRCRLLETFTLKYIGDNCTYLLFDE